MQAINNHNVSEPLRLTLRQQAVLEALKRKETEKYPLSRWYHGALYAFDDERNPDRVAQAAQSLREILEKLPLVVLGVELPRSSSKFAQKRSLIEHRLLKDKKRYSQGWKYNEIDVSLDETLKEVENYCDLYKTLPSRRQQIQRAVTEIDPMSNQFDNRIQGEKRKRLGQLRDELEGFAHHRTPNVEEFKQCLGELERTVFELLAPITAEDQKEIQAILRRSNRSATDIERIFSLIKRKGANYVYFFKQSAETADIAWLSHLDKRGYFANPPTAELISEEQINFPYWWPMHYLVGIAKHAPDKVIGIVKKLPSVDNPWVHHEILNIALRLSGEQSTRLLSKILESTGLEYKFWANQYTNLLTHWITQNQNSAALELTRALVEFTPDPESEVKRQRWHENSEDPATIAETLLEPLPRIDSGVYHEVMTKGVYPLAETEPYKVARILIDATANMIRLRIHKHTPGTNEDFSESWCERLDESRGNSEDPKETLVHALVFACDQVFKSARDSVTDLDKILRNQQWKIFRRIRQHLCAQHLNVETKPWIRELILTHEDYHLWGYRDEFQRMIKSACKYFGESLLSNDELNRIFNTIRSGPSKTGYKEWMKWLGEEFNEERFTKRQRHFHRMQLRPFVPLLFGNHAVYFHELEKGANILISDEDYSPPKVGSVSVSNRSPRSTEDLENFTDEELLFFINEWNEETQLFEHNNLIKIDIEGLSRTFQTVFQEQIIPNSKRHKFWMENCQKIERPIFVERMIGVMREWVEENKFDYFDEWLTFSEWVLSHPDDRTDEIYDRHAGESRDNPNWSNSRWAIADVIGSCFRRDVNPPVSARAQLAILLEMLCTQYNWHLDNNRESFSNKMDLADKAINNVRGGALRDLVNFGLWLRRHDLATDTSEVTSILEKRFAPEVTHSLTLPEYAILGLNYNRIFYLNKSWATEHKSDFFPQADLQAWLAAFGSFVHYNGACNLTFDVLKDDYGFALKHLKDLEKQGRNKGAVVYSLAKAIYSYYLSDIYSLRSEDSLLERYYQVTDNNRKHWANLFEHAGRTMWTNEHLDPNLREKFIAFFDWRIEVAEPNELQRFTFWMRAEYLDAPWRLEALAKILDVCKPADMLDSFPWEVLCKMLPDYTAKVVACFAKLTDGIGAGNINIYAEEAKAILKTGLESSDENIRRDAVRAHENLLSVGRLDMEALADEMANKFMEFVGPGRPPLSNHAVSREGIYEDD